MFYFWLTTRQFLIFHPLIIILLKWSSHPTGEDILVGQLDFSEVAGWKGFESFILRGHEPDSLGPAALYSLYPPTIQPATGLPVQDSSDSTSQRNTAINRMVPLHPR